MGAAVERLRDRVLRAGGWTVLGAVSNQVLRFASNLVLTRLLYPEAFGLMAIVTALLVGVTMLTDVGLSMSIVRSRRGADEKFMNTIWTLQVAKGALIALGLLCMANSVADAYHEPLLGAMLPVLGLVALLSGFNSTKADLAVREVNPTRPVLIGLAAQVTGIVIMIGWGWMHPSPWAILFGNVAAAAVYMTATHLALAGPRNRFAWDPAAAREVAHFGGWVMAGSAVAYFAGEGAQLVRAALVDLRFLGLIGLAGALSAAAWSVLQQVSGRVLFPAYAEVWRNEPGRQSLVVEHARRVQLFAGGLFATAMTIAGPSIVAVLYDPRYKDAGLVLQIQSAGMLALLLSSTYAGVLNARGRPGLSTAILLCQVLINLASMVIGARLAGGLGVVVGGALTGWLFYPINAWVYHRLGLWHPRTDFPVLIWALMLFAWVAFSVDWSTTRI